MESKLDPKSGDLSLPVDLIRTVAIVLVILLHASLEPNLSVDFMSPQGVELWCTSDAYKSIAIAGVPLFAMLTGALLLQPSKVDEPLRIFFKKRWSRIGLPLIFWGLVYFAWSFFVRGKPLTPDNVLVGILTGPYYHFWFMYVLIGFYLLTPVLRVLIAKADWKIMKYLLILWLVGTALVPFIGLYENLNPAVNWFQRNVFFVTGLLGFFILGPYVTRLRFSRRQLYALLGLGVLSTAVGTYFLIGTLGMDYSRFLIDAASLSSVATSVSLFLILARTQNQLTESGANMGNRVLHAVSENTLPIYLFHLIVLETLQNGYLGFQISVTTINPVVSIPLLTALTLFICLAIFVPLKKVPYLKRVLG